MEQINKLKPKRKAGHLLNLARRATSGIINLEQYLLSNLEGENATFTIHAHRTPHDGTMTVIIEPDDETKDVFHGYVFNQSIEPKKAIDNMMKMLREKPYQPKDK